MYYIQTQQEDIGKKENIIKDLELAIEKKQNIEIIHNGNSYKVSPLKIAQFDGFWYLISYNTKYFTYRIKDISSLQITQETHEKGIEDDLNLDEWYNVWHTPNAQPTKVKILIENSIFHYFEEKNILGKTGTKVVSEPEVLDDIPNDTFYHITELINQYIQTGEKVGVYPVSDKSWLDMGQFREMQDMIERLGFNK